MRLSINLLVFMIMLTPGGALSEFLDIFNPQCDENYGEIWNQSWTEEPRGDLRCHSSCNKPELQTMSAEDRQTDYDKCCTCNSCAVWEGHEIELFIEFVSVLGRSLVVSNQASSENDVYKIEQKNSFMTEIPSNLCVWDNESGLKERYPDVFSHMQDFMSGIVLLNFENNQIRKLPDIECLDKLDELNLKNNQLTSISNTSFTNLKHLRNIDLSGNLIKKIDPNIFTSKDMISLFNVNFQQNKLCKLDVSNMISLYPFCKIDYQKNEITKLVNENNFCFNLSLTYGPGFVCLRYNKISKFPDFEKLLNLDEITQLGHLFSFGFDLRDIPLKCDCYIEPFMERAYEVVNHIWRDYMNITCKEPEELAGQSVVNVTPEKLICEKEKGCDPRCTCVDQPSKNTSFIDCSNSDLKTLPEIPSSRYSYFVSLNVSNNDISVIGNISYLHRISMLDISGNNLKEINNTIAKRLENASYIDISNNPRLQQLPQMLQYHNVCSRHMEGLQISCDCQSLWIEHWVHSKSCDTSENLFQCDIPTVGIKPALEFSEDDLECIQDIFHTLLEILIAAAILILILIGTIVYIFRYEILILYLRMRQKSRNIIIPLNKYDVFLSFNDIDENVNKWVTYSLEPKLIKAGYRVFQPSRDVPFGAERDSGVIDVLAKTRNFLTIMSESYLLEEEEGMRSWTENEWKYGWNNFKADRSKNIVLVNFDHLSSFNVIKLQIKAFLRVGGSVDFKNHNRNIMQEIFDKLGRPIGMSMANKALDNKNKKFTQFDIFTTPYKTPIYPKDIEEKFNTEDITNIFTEVQVTKNITPDANDINDPSKSQKYLQKKKKPRNQPKKCTYRKCEACRYKNNEQQTIQNNPKVKQEWTKRKDYGKGMVVKNSNNTFATNDENPTGKTDKMPDAEHQHLVHRESSCDSESCEMPWHQDISLGEENIENFNDDTAITNEYCTNAYSPNMRKAFDQIHNINTDKMASEVDISKDNTTDFTNSRTNSRTSSTYDINSLSDILIKSTTDKY